MVCEVDQLVLAFFAETINCTGTHRVANLAGGMFAICEHFDDNGILSINFFSTHTTAPMCAHKTEPLPCPHLLLFSWLFSTLTHTHTQTYRHTDMCLCVSVAFGQTVFVALGLFSHVLQLPMQIELPSVPFHTQDSVYLFACACDCNEYM